MSHQDDAHLRRNVASFKAILRSAVPESVEGFTRHGNAVLSPFWLASVALTCWGWMADGTLTERVSAACDVVGYIFDVKGSVTRQGLMKALATCGAALVELMIDSLSSHVRSLKGHWTESGKVNIAVDGSKFAAPRTAENQAFFAAPVRKRKKRYKRKSDQSKASTVQVLLTVCWHMTTGLPLRWRTTASHGSERRNVADMLDSLPRNARLIGDAEYVGYPLWSKICNSERSFLIRVGSNVTFLKKLGKHRIEDGFVYYWPVCVMNKNGQPIVLRMFQIRDGKKAVYLVTNELDMSDELAGRLYAARWKVEMFFRTVKQTCEHAKLLCLRPENVLTELNWTLLGIWYALFAGKQAQVNEGRSPDQLSPVKVISAFREVAQTLRRQAAGVPLLHDQLIQAIVKDETNRISSKTSRRFPSRKKRRRCGKPIILTPTRQQRRIAKALKI